MLGKNSKNDRKENSIRPASEEELENRIRPADEEELPISVEPEPIEDKEEEEPISLVDEDETEPDHHVRIRQSGSGRHDKQYKRKPNSDGTGAIRCRVFHCRIATESLANLEERVNDWLDKEEIEVKQVEQCIGTMEGKTPKPNLIMTVWY